MNDKGLIEYKNTFIYPAELTKAKFRYNVDQLRVLLFIINSYQENYKEQIIKGERIQERTDLFGIKTFEKIPIKDIWPGAKYTRTRDAVFEMNKQKFIMNSEEEEAQVALIEMPRLQKKKGTITFSINPVLRPYFETLTKQFGVLDQSVIPKLGVYSLRFIMMVSVFRNRGVFYINARELKARFLLEENQYEKFSVFKSKVIDKALNEIKVLFENKKCNLMIHYDQEASKKRSKSDDWDRNLTFKIISYDNPNRQLKPSVTKLSESEVYQELVGILKYVFENNKVLLEKLLGHVLNLNSEKRETLHDRLMREMEKYEKLEKSRRNNPDLQALITHILKEDYSLKIIKEEFNIEKYKKGIDSKRNKVKG